MILINKQSYNTVALTLREKSLLTGTTYNLFVFSSDSTGVEKVFTVDDTSSYKDRYNLFTIREAAATEDLLNGRIHLTGNTSEWSYSVYESASPFSANTLSITATTGTILEIGRVQVKGIEGDTNINEIYL